MTNAKVHEGFRVDKKVEEHWSKYSKMRVGCGLPLPTPNEA